MSILSVQIKYLSFVAKAELTKLENHYKTLGYEVHLDRIKDQGKFSAPEDMHEKIKCDIEALAQISETTFEIDKPGFDNFVRKDYEQIRNLVKSKCYIDKTVSKQQIQISIPKARSANHENTARPIENVKAINVGQSTISVTFGDLTAQIVNKFSNK